MQIIDTPWNTKAKLACLVANNVKTIIRYYNFSNSERLPQKSLTLAEAESICAAGINIAVVFQQNQRTAQDFSELKGYEAGLRAYRYAHNNIGQPEGSGIYFSVDFDATKAEINNNVVPYFNGVVKAFNEVSNNQPIYRVGVYGSGATGAALTKKNLCSLVWLAMSSGFAGTKNAIKTGAYNLEQRLPEAALCGLDVDYNYANPNNPDFGAFTIHHHNSTDVVNISSAKYQVISRTNLRLREGPGTSYDIVGKLNSGQIVTANFINAEWASVDIEGDGLIDGFVSLAYLKKI